MGSIDQENVLRDGTEFNPQKIFSRASQRITPEDASDTFSKARRSAISREFREDIQFREGSTEQNEGRGEEESIGGWARKGGLLLSREYLVESNENASGEHGVFKERKPITKYGRVMGFNPRTIT